MNLVFVAIVLEIIVLLIRFIIEYKKYKEYMNSDYCHMTHVSYWSMLSDAGRRGEYDTYRYLRSLDGYKKFLFNCYIPKEDGTMTEVDVILLHESGIYVLESKNYSGWIFGTETQKQWTQTLATGKGKTRKEHFLNPIIQNKVHLKWLQTYLKDFDNLTLYSYIVFSIRCELKNITLTSGNHFVVKRDNLLEAVSRNAAASNVRMTKSLIDEVYKKLYPLTQVDEAKKTLHIEQIKNRYEHPATIRNNSESQDRKCPQCGGELVLRVAKKGDFAGNKFYGCSNYPKCKYVQNIKNRE